MLYSPRFNSSKPEVTDGLAEAVGNAAKNSCGQSGFARKGGFNFKAWMARLRQLEQLA